MAFLIISLTSVYSTVHSGADQRKHQSSASLAFVRGPVKSPHKWPVTRKMFSYDDVIMQPIVYLSFCSTWGRWQWKRRFLPVPSIRLQRNCWRTINFCLRCCTQLQLRRHMILDRGGGCFFPVAVPKVSQCELVGATRSPTWMLCICGNVFGELPYK